MGYLFLSFALLCGVTKGYCGKKTGDLTKTLEDAISVNSLRMLICMVIGFLLVFASGQGDALRVTSQELLLMTLSGITTTLFVVTWILSVKRGAYLLLEVFLMLGVLVPVIGSLAMYGEPVVPLQWVGVALLVISAYLMCTYSNKEKRKMTPMSFLLLALCGLSSGATDLLQKTFVKSATDTPLSVFHFYTYTVSLLCLLPLLLLITKGSVKQAYTGMKTILRRAAGYIFVMAVCLFLNAYFKTVAAEELSATILYPMSQGGGLILSSFMTAIFFREKITGRCMFGICVAFIGLLLINFQLYA